VLQLGHNVYYNIAGYNIVFEIVFERQNII